MTLKLFSSAFKSLSKSVHLLGKYSVKEFKDELISGLAGRYSIHTLTHSVPQVSQDLFEDPLYGHSIRFPHRIQSFYQNFKLQLSHCAFDIINNHTLWPFYRAFLNPKKKSILMKMVLSGQPFFQSHHAFKDLKTPYYCPKCINECQLEYGEIFFNRIHQLPDIQICTIHGCCLEQANHNNKIHTNRKLCLPLIESCPTKESLNNNSELIKTIALRMVGILKGTTLIDLNYRDRLSQLGYSNSTRILKSKIIDEFISFYGQDHLKLYNITPEFIPSILYNPFRITNTTRHILFDYFIQNLKTNGSTPKVKYWDKYLFDKSHYCCPNSHCSNYQKSAQPKALTFTYDRKSRKTIGNFKCTCGTSFTMSFKLVNNQFEPILTRKRSKAVKKKLQISQLSIVKKRNAFLSLLKMSSRTYAEEIKTIQLRFWLGKNDPSWFNKQHSLLKDILRQKQVDLSKKRDKDSLSKLKTTVEMLRVNHNPKRLTKNFLLKESKVQYIGPESSKFIKKVIEPLFEFRKRAISQKAKAIFEKGEDLTLKKLLSNYHDKGKLRPFAMGLLEQYKN